MADPVSIATGIITVLETTRKVIEYLRDVNDASETKKNILVEVIGAKSFLETLRELVHFDGEGTDVASNVQTLKEPLNSYGALLTKLEALLAPVRGMKKLGKQFTWPFQKEEASAILSNLARYRSLFGLALQADQLELSRAVRLELQAIRNDQQEEELREIVRWLSPLNFEAKHQLILSKRQPGTGSWLLNDERFGEWKCGQSRFLWCPGYPGAGKTVCASIVINHLRETFREVEENAVLGIYFDYREFNRHSTSKYIASLLQQLILQRNFIPEPIRAAYRLNAKNQTFPSFPEYLELLLQQLDSFKHVHIVIDALDECTEADGARDEIIEALLQLPRETSVLVTSRYIKVIEERFGDFPRLDIVAQEDDIRRHVNGRIALEKSWVRRIRLDNSLKVKIADSIVERARGMFLLAQLHISAVVRKHSKKDVERALKDLPEGITSTYDQILERINDQYEEDAALARKVLTWLAFARAPLTATMLQQALAIKAQDEAFDEDAMIHEETLLDVCAGLVQMEQETNFIQFVHYTTQEYFLNVRTSAFPSGPLEITTTCLTFLLFDEETKEKMTKLYTYVADNWGHHARESPETPDLVDKIVAFVNDEDRLKHCVENISTSHSTSKYSTLMQSLHLAAKFDLSMTLGKLLLNDAVDVNTEDNGGRTPLFYAAAADHGSATTLLLDTPGIKIDVPSFFHGTPLHSAIEAGREDIAKTLLKRGANPESEDCQGARPIHKAVDKGLKDILEALLALKADITARTNSGHNPIYLAMQRDSAIRQKTVTGLYRAAEVTASYKEYLPALRLLLDSITATDIDNGDMMFEAVRVGRPDVLEILLAKGPRLSVKKPRYKNRTPLHWASENGLQRCVEIALRHGSDPNIQDDRGYMPLHYAAIAGRTTVVGTLIPHTANINLLAQNGLSPLHCATIQGHEEIVSLLRQAGALHQPLPSSYRMEDDDHALRHRDNNATVLSGNGAPRSFTPNGRMLSADEYRRYAERLISAAAAGDIEGVLLSLSKGVYVGERDHLHHKTAVHWAAENGHTNIAQLLIQQGIDFKSLDQYGETPLHYAAESGYNDVVRILVERGAVLSWPDDLGRTPLRCARDNYHIDVVKTLLAAGEPTVQEAEERDKQGKSLMHWAAEIGDEAISTRLKRLSLSANALAPDNRGWLPHQYYDRKYSVGTMAKVGHI